ncbi:MAG: hypothetical protein ACM3NQ_19375 [Bacteroidales bacterium]
MSKLVASSIVLLALCAGSLALAQQPNVVTRESTVTATVDRIERSSRVVTFRGEGNVFHSVYVDPAVKEFDGLKVGDIVTVRYVESAIVKVNPRAKLSAGTDTTEAARKAGKTNVVAQIQAVVTIESIDSDGLFVRYRTADNVIATRAVADKTVLKGLHAGDRVEVTLTRERAVSIERARR